MSTSTGNRENQSCIYRSLREWFAGDDGHLHDGNGNAFQSVSDADSTFEATGTEVEEQKIRARLKLYSIRGYAVVTTRYIFDAALLSSPTLKASLDRSAVEWKLSLHNKSLGKDTPVFMVAVIGFGRVGSMITRALLQTTDLLPSSLLVVTKESRGNTVVIEDTEVSATTDASKASDADVIILCVPQSEVACVASKLNNSGSFETNPVVLSFVAGVPRSSIRRIFRGYSVVVPKLHLLQEWINEETKLRIPSIAAATNFRDLIPISSDKVTSTAFEEDYEYIDDLNECIRSVILRHSYTGTANVSAIVLQVLGASVLEKPSSAMSASEKICFTDRFCDICDSLELIQKSMLRQRDAMLKEIMK